METALERMELLIKREGLEKLKQANVMIVGVGGVGSYAAEAIARSGVGRILLVDGDTIALSNLNRQIHANYKTIGRKKSEVMKERIETYRLDCSIQCKHIFYDENQNEIVFKEPVQFVIDAIDTMTSKLSLIKYCKEHNIPFISSMGMANRMDPTKVTCCDITKTTYDPVAKVMRKLIRKHNIKGAVPVVYSKEQPSIQKTIINEAGHTRKQRMPPASSPFVPAAAGLACASYVITTLLKEETHPTNK